MPVCDVVWGKHDAGGIPVQQESGADDRPYADCNRCLGELNRAVEPVHIRDRKRRIAMLGGRFQPLSGRADSSLQGVVGMANCKHQMNLEGANIYEYIYSEEGRYSNIGTII